MRNAIFNENDKYYTFYIDKKVSISVIASLLAAVVTAIWAVSDSRNQLDNMQKAIERYDKIPTKVIRLEEKVDQIKEDVSLVKDYLIGR